jgi:hypothetical protein
MGEFKYAKELLRSFTELFRKPILLTPFVGIFVLSTVFLLITPKMPASPALEPGTVAWIVGLGLIQLLLALFFSAVGLAGFRMLLGGEEVKCRPRFLAGARMYFRLLLLRIYQVLIILVPLVLIMIVYFPVYYASVQFANILLIVLLVLYVIYLVMMAFFFLFSNVIIAYDGKSAKASLMESYAYFKRDSAHIFFTILSVVVLLLVYWLVLALISAVFAWAGGVSAAAVTWREIIIYFISIPLGAAITLFLFKAFRNAPTAAARENETPGKALPGTASAPLKAAPAKKAKKATKKKKK